MTERDEKAIEKDLKSMVEAAQRAEAAKAGSAKEAISPLHAVHIPT